MQSMFGGRFMSFNVHNAIPDRPFCAASVWVGGDRFAWDTLTSGILPIEVDPSHVFPRVIALWKMFPKNFGKKCAILCAGGQITS
jgi:hypothetical protein